MRTRPDASRRRLASTIATSAGVAVVVLVVGWRLGPQQADTPARPLVAPLPFSITPIDPLDANASLPGFRQAGAAVRIAAPIPAGLPVEGVTAVRIAGPPQAAALGRWMGPGGEPIGETVTVGGVAQAWREVCPRPPSAVGLLLEAATPSAQPFLVYVQARADIDASWRPLAPAWTEWPVYRVTSEDLPLTWELPATPMVRYIPVFATAFALSPGATITVRAQTEGGADSLSLGLPLSAPGPRAARATFATRPMAVPVVRWLTIPANTAATVRVNGPDRGEAWVGLADGHGPPAAVVETLPPGCPSPAGFRAPWGASPVIGWEPQPPRNAGATMYDRLHLPGIPLPLEAPAPEPLTEVRALLPTSTADLAMHRRLRPIPENALCSGRRLYRYRVLCAGGRVDVDVAPNSRLEGVLRGSGGPGKWHLVLQPVSAEPDSPPLRSAVIATSAGGVCRWRFGTVPAGRYALTLAPLGENPGGTATLFGTPVPVDGGFGLIEDARFWAWAVGESRRFALPEPRAGAVLTLEAEVEEATLAAGGLLRLQIHSPEPTPPLRAFSDLTRRDVYWQLPAVSECRDGHHQLKLRLGPDIAGTSATLRVTVVNAPAPVWLRAWVASP